MGEAVEQSLQRVPAVAVSEHQVQAVVPLDPPVVGVRVPRSLVRLEEVLAVVVEELGVVLALVHEAADDLVAECADRAGRLGIAEVGGGLGEKILLPPPHRVRVREGRRGQGQAQVGLQVLHRLELRALGAGVGVGHAGPELECPLGSQTGRELLREQGVVVVLRHRPVEGGDVIEGHVARMLGHLRELLRRGDRLDRLVPSP